MCYSDIGHLQVIVACMTLIRIRCMVKCTSIKVTTLIIGLPYDHPNPSDFPIKTVVAILEMANKIIIIQHITELCSTRHLCGSSNCSN